MGINQGWANDHVVIRTLDSLRINLKTLTGVSLLGWPEKLTCSQDAEGLKIKVGRAILRRSRRTECLSRLSCSAAATGVPL